MFREDDIAVIPFSQFLLAEREPVDSIDIISFRMPVELVKYTRYFQNQYNGSFMQKYQTTLTFSEIVRCAILYGYDMCKSVLSDVFEVDRIIEGVLRPTEDYRVLSEIDEFYHKISRYNKEIQMCFGSYKRRVNVRSMYDSRYKVIEVSDKTNLNFGDSCNVLVTLAYGSEVKFKTYYNLINALRRYADEVIFEFEEMVTNRRIARYLGGVEVKSDVVKDIIERLQG